MNGIPMEYGYCLTIIDFPVLMTLNSACAWLARGPLGRVGTSQRVFVMIKWILMNVLEREKLMGSNACTSVSGSLMRRWGLFLTFLDCIGPMAQDPIRMNDPILRKKRVRKHGDSYRIISQYTAICKWDFRSHSENVDKKRIRNPDIIISLLYRLFGLVFREWLTFQP